VILQAIKDRTTKNSEQICFLGVDDHTWVVKETPKTGIFVLGEDGKSYAMADASADPLTLIQREKLDKNRPFLYVMPWRFNKTGNYINPEVITDDLLNVELQFQVENIGDKEATDISFTDGEPYTKPLRPGEKIYYKNQVTLERKAGAKAQELIKKERYLTYGTTVAYRPESGNKGYITRFLYEIGEDEVRLIKYEVQ
jgi:hypothetical protein